MSKKKTDFRSKIDSILADTSTETAPGSQGGTDRARASGRRGDDPLARLLTPTTETKLDEIRVSQIKAVSVPADGELTASVKSRGVIQPILLRPAGRGYEVIDGARRLAAARAAGLTRIPAVVRSISNADAAASITARATRAAASRTATRRAGGAAPRRPASRATAKPAAKATPKAVTKPAVKVASRPVAKSAAKAAIKVASKAVTRPAVKVASRPVAKSAAKAAIKVASKAVTKPAVKVASRPVAKSAAKAAPKRGAAQPAAARARAVRPVATRALPGQPAAARPTATRARTKAVVRSKPVSEPIPKRSVKAAPRRSRRSTPETSVAAVAAPDRAVTTGPATVFLPESPTPLVPSAPRPQRVPSLPGTISFPREEAQQVAAASAVHDADLTGAAARVAPSRPVAVLNFGLFLASVSVLSFAATNFLLIHDNDLGARSAIAGSVGVVLVLVLLVTRR